MQNRNATVAVIGAGDYIGGEIAKKFAAEGFTVFAGRRNGEKLEPLVKEVEAAFHHMWVEPKKMDDPEVAAKAFSASGLDAAKLFARAQEPEVKAKLIENTQSAVERGAFGSPTFFVGKEMFFGKEQLREVEELVSGK